MNGLLRKDRAWALPMAIGGAIALGLVGGHNGFLRVFVMGHGRNEELFYTAACMGLFVGALARSWDRLIGTHEFLRYRPVSPAQLATAPLRSAALVVGFWTAAAPAIAWVFASFWSGVFEPTYWSGYGGLMATIAIAWPAAAVGSAAVALPLPWWLRAVFGVCAALVVGYLIVRAAEGGEGHSGTGIYLVACALATALFGWLARTADQVPFDADAPWTPRTTRWCGTAVAVVLGLTFAGAALDGQRMAIQTLMQTYPELGAGKGRVVLWRHGALWSDRRICDAEHRLTDERYDGRKQREVGCVRPWPRRLFEVEAPRWHAGGDIQMLGGVSLILDHRGNAWGFVRRTQELYAMGRQGRTGTPFAPGSRFHDVDDVGDKASWQSHPFVVDAADQSLWHVDAERNEFVPFDLPGGDRFLRTRFLHHGNAPGAVPLLRSLLDGAPSGAVEYVVGERGCYVMRNEQWVEAPISREARDPRARTWVEGVDSDAVSFTVRLPASEEHPAFEHRFTPRTFAEQAHFVHASAWSLLRPPVLQLASFARARPEREGTVTLLDDHLLRGQSRVWLLLLCAGISGFSVWATRRRLRRLGVDASVVTFWTFAAASLGVAGVLACRMCVRARAFRRPVIEAAPAPRIGANPVHQEVMS